MKDKRGDDWYRPWVVRPDLLRSQPRTSRGFGRNLPKGRSSSSTRLNDIGAKLEILDNGTHPAPNRMTAGYSLANLSNLSDDFNCYHSLSFAAESAALNRSFEDALDDEEDEASLYSLPVNGNSDALPPASLFAKQKMVQKTLSLPFRYFENEWNEGSKSLLSQSRECHASILTNKTPKRGARMRRCPSPHSKIANGVFLSQDQRDDNESLSLKLLNAKKKTNLQCEYSYFFLS